MTLEEYYELIKPYTDAMNLILTRLEIMDHDTYEKEDFGRYTASQTGSKKKKVLRISSAKKVPRGACRTPK